MDFYPRSLLERHGLISLAVAKCSTAGMMSTNIDWVPDSALFEKRAAELSSRTEERSIQLQQAGQLDCLAHSFEVAAGSRMKNSPTSCTTLKSTRSNKHFPL